MPVVLLVVLLLGLLASGLPVSPVQPGGRAIALPLILGGADTASPSPAPSTPTATPTPTTTPTRPISGPPTATRTVTPTPAQFAQPACHPSYPDFCIPPRPPDLDCGSRALGGRTNFTVLEPDPHRLDGDNDGVGCEG
jgi:hypothetical protein